MEIFQWQFPVGPGTPFGSPELVALDCLRILIVACGVITVLLTIPSLAMTWSLTQKYRLLCIAMFSIYVSMTEIQRIGDHANWRLLLGATCSIWAVVSLFAFIRFEGNPERAGWVKSLSVRSGDGPSA